MLATSMWCMSLKLVAVHVQLPEASQVVEFEMPYHKDIVVLSKLQLV